ncbi:MAG TPA: molecular chaperone DnaJ, partial [Synechococcus sp. UBA8071]|nr:molecular chaperone DnaJ [Synechococcus sp. UBA8071]
MACFGDQLVQESKGFGGQARSAKRKSSKKRKPGTSNHRRDQCPMGRDPGLEAIQA